MAAIFALSTASPACKKSTFSPVPSTRRAPRFRVSAFAAAMVSPAPATMYDLLSVSHTAGVPEIRAAYRRLALRWHPDACRSAGEEHHYAERFMEAREAFEVLSDAARRRDYDLALSGNRWPAAVADTPAFREGRARRREGGATAFGNWNAQLDGLWQRSAAAERRRGAEVAGETAEAAV